MFREIKCQLQKNKVTVKLSRYKVKCYENWSSNHKKFSHNREKKNHGWDIKWNLYRNKVSLSYKIVRKNSLYEKKK